jgi:hypothetical protein
MSKGPPEQGPQAPMGAPRTPTIQRLVSETSLLHSTPFNWGTPTQDGEASSLLYARSRIRAAHRLLTPPRVKFVDPLLYDDLKDHQVAKFENVLKELLWRASTKAAGIPEDLSTDQFCTTLLGDALAQVTPFCNQNTSPEIFANLNI